MAERERERQQCKQRGSGGRLGWWLKESTTLLHVSMAAEEGAEE
jgi:hypothetical protein